MEREIYVSELIHDFLGDWLKVTHPEMADKIAQIKAERKFVTE